MPTPPIPTWQTQVGLAKETTWSTYVAPTTLDQFMPVTNPKPADEIDSIIDAGNRGLLGATQGFFQGFRIGRWAWEQHAFPEPIGHLFMGLLGLDNWATARTTADGVLNSTTTLTSATMAFVGGDVGKDITGIGIPANTVIASVTNGTTVIMSQAATATGGGVSITVGGTTSHPITARTSGLPPSYSISDFYGIAGTNTRAQAGSYIESVAISGGSTGPLKFTVTTIGTASPFAGLKAKPTAVYTAAAPFLPWQGAITLNSVINLKALQFDLLLKQPIDPILAMGSQDPSAMNAGTLEVTGKLLFAPTDDTEYLLYTTAQQAAFPLSAVFTSGATSLALIMSKVNFEKPTVFERNTPYVKTNVSFRAIHNASDTGPIRVNLVGGKSAAAY